MVELRYFEALSTSFGDASSGLALRSDAFVQRSVWVPDVTVQLTSGRLLLVEYDGCYWHANKMDVDRGKSLDLLATGALVVRLREAPLPSLDINSRDYLELTVYSTTPDPDSAIAAIRTWLNVVDKSGPSM